MLPPLPGLRKSLSQLYFEQFKRPKWRCPTTSGFSFRSGANLDQNMIASESFQSIPVISAYDAVACALLVREAETMCDHLVMLKVSPRNSRLSGAGKATNDIFEPHLLLLDMLVRPRNHRGLIGRLTRDRRTTTRLGTDVGFAELRPRTKSSRKPRSISGGHTEALGTRAMSS